MNKFNTIIKHIIFIEGGDTFTNHPDDRGGPTKYGITQDALQAFRGPAVIVTSDDVKNLDQATAELIYKINYWNPLSLDDIVSEDIARFMMDLSVHSGHSVSARIAQLAHNDTKPSELLSVDGKIGPKSIEALNKVNVYDFMLYFLDRQQDRYASIVRDNRTQASFIAGWINRSQYNMHYLFSKMKTQMSKQSVTETEGPSGIIKIILDAISSFFSGTYKESKTPSDLTHREKLLILLKEHGLPANHTTRLLGFWDKAKNKKYLSFVNFGISSQYPRMFVINTETLKLEHKWQCAHGSGSNLSEKYVVESFSNVPGSNATPSGVHRIGDNYGKVHGGWSKFNYAMFMHGLEKENSNSYSRAIRLHDATYVESGGRSLGCYALAPSDAAIATSILKDTVIFGHKWIV